MTSYGYLITKMADSENVRSSINNDLVTEKSEDSSAKERRPIQQAALKGRQQIQDRAEILCTPQKMSGTSNNSYYNHYCSIT